MLRESMLQEQYSIRMYPPRTGRGYKGCHYEIIRPVYLPELQRAFHLPRYHRRLWGRSSRWPDVVEGIGIGFIGLRFQPI